MPNKLNTAQFIRPSTIPTSIISIADFMLVVEKHEGLFVIEDIAYDNVTAGKDNLYFSYCFNYNSGKAINETLFIVDEIIDDNINNRFILIAQNKQHVVFFKD